MKKFPKMMLLTQAALLMLLAATAAWGSVENGILNNSREDVDLSISGYYKEGTAYNEIRLGSSSVNLVGDVNLGGAGLNGYAENYNDAAVIGGAGGAIYLGEGDTLNFSPLAGKGIKGMPGSSLRLFGRGTANILGENNNYSYTFIQSGTLNIKSAKSLGGSILTMGGGSTLGIIGGDGQIDLSGVTINVRRYNSSGAKAEGATEIVTFDTGKYDTNRIILPQIKQLSAATGSSSEEKIIISKRGKGRLVAADVLDHTGDTIVEDGELEIKSSPRRSGTVEIKPGASLIPTETVLNTLNIKPHAGAAIILPQSNGTASLILEKAGPAVLEVLDIDPMEITDNGSFTIKADLSGILRPQGVEEDEYYVKLISSTSQNGLEESDVKISGTVRADFAESYYAVKPYVDGFGIYALLSKDVLVSGTIDVKVLHGGQDAVVTAKLSDERSGAEVLFEIRNSFGERVKYGEKVSDGGIADYVFSDLDNGDYVISVSSPGYFPSERNVKIDGTYDLDNTPEDTVPGSLGVTISDVYNESQSSDVMAVRIQGNETLSGGAFKYRFVATGGTKTGEVANPVTSSTVFTANDVAYDSDNPQNALFYIDRNSLTADDGLVYQLEPGIRYRLVVNGTSESGGSSDTLIESGGIYVASGETMLVTYAEPVSSDSIAAWAVARKDGELQVGVRVDFALLDIFGNPVNIQGIPNNPFQLTDISGRADVTFRHLPYGKYIVRAKASDSPYVGYSREIEFFSPSSGGGGGCASFTGILAVLFAAGVVCANKRRQAR